MSQTVKFGRVRAAADPDLGDSDAYNDAGVYFGSNIPYLILATRLKPGQRAMQRTTRGACVNGRP